MVPEEWGKGLNEDCAFADRARVHCTVNYCNTKSRVMPESTQNAKHTAAPTASKMAQGIGFVSIVYKSEPRCNSWEATEGQVVGLRLPHTQSFRNPELS